MRDADGPSARFRQAGLLTAIPFVLLVGPALGYYLGSALDRRWAHAPWGMVGGIVVGLFASARVTVQLIQQSRTPPSDHD
jgi:F0F1-type ATP synthase assembly protein I